MSQAKRVIIEPSKSGKIATSRINKAVRSVHVAPKRDGGWEVKQGGKDKVVAHFSRKSDAITYGRELSLERQTGMYVHQKNGKVQEVNSFGNDPNPPRG